MKKISIKKIISLIVFFLLIIVVIAIMIVNLKKDNKSSETPELILKYQNAQVELNNEIYNLDCITKIENGNIITNKELVDTTTIGQKEVEIEVEDLKKQIKKITLYIDVIDTEKPTITFSKEVNTLVGKEINLLNNIVVTDNSNETIIPTIEGDYDINVTGTYNLFYVATDSSNNTSKEGFILNVIEDKKSTNGNNSSKVNTSTQTKTNNASNTTKPNTSTQPSTQSSSTTTQNNSTTSSPSRPSDNKNQDNSNTEIYFTTSKGFKGVTKNGVTYIDGYLVVNKTYSLPSSYGSDLTSQTKTAANEMFAAAKLEGLNIYISSGYRSYATQKRLYNNYVNRDGKEKADTYSARPGHSEHQSGLAFDVNQINDSFNNTPEAKWLANNCYKYGFILRYPEGKTNETGYKYESWHFRYVGKELAQMLYNNGDWITMEDYFGITSEYN